MTPIQPLFLLVHTTSAFGVRNWLGHLSLLHSAHQFVLIGIGAIVGLVVARSRRWRVISTALAGVGFILCPLVGWVGLSAAGGLHFRAWRRVMLAVAAVWTVGVFVWYWSHPADHVPASVIEVLVGLVVVLGVAGLAVWSRSHLGSKWRPTGPRCASKAQAAQVRAKYNNRCAICGVSGDNPGVSMEIDHIVPYALGGKTEVSNLGLTCHNCNSQKGKMTVQEFQKSKRWTGA